VSLAHVAQGFRCAYWSLGRALWHGRRCAGRPNFHVTTTQVDLVTPFVVCTERWITVEEALPVAVALPMLVELVPVDAALNPVNEKSVSRMNRSAM
jgi:hypothetical protein